jgi:hypothetical protein
MNNDKNISLKKIMDDSNIFFDKCINILEKDNEIKKIFYYFMYNDLINIDKNNNFKNINIKYIIEDPIYTIKENLQNIKNTINIEYIEELKKNIKNKHILIKKKNLECKNHINIIKNLYYEMYIERFLPSSKKDNTIFENKTVLFIDDDYYKYKLGLFFAKLIFSLIKSDDSKNNSSLEKNFNNFFNIEDYKEDYLNSEKNDVTDFKDIDINFKYWFIIVFISGVLFGNNSKYNYIFNFESFEEHIKKLSILDNPKNNKSGKKKKDKKKKQKGGNNSEIKSNKQKIIKKNKDRKKLPIISIDPKKLYILVLQKCFINKKDTLFSIYYLNFQKNIKQYFINKISDEYLKNNSSSINPNNIYLDDPFSIEKLKLKSITEYKGDIIDKSSLKNVFNNIKYSIFNFLKVYLNSDNFKIIKDFLSKVKKYLILLLFYLYNMKKNIYKEYLKISSEIFDIPLNKNNNKNVNKNKKKNNSKSTSINMKKNNSKVNNVNQKIKKIQNMIDSLKSKKNISDYHEKILKLEHMKKKIIMQKYYE